MKKMDIKWNLFLLGTLSPSSAIHDFPSSNWSSWGSAFPGEFPPTADNHAT